MGCTSFYKVRISILAAGTVNKASLSDVLKRLFASLQATLSRSSLRRYVTSKHRTYASNKS